MDEGFRFKGGIYNGIGNEYNFRHFCSNAAFDTLLLEKPKVIRG